MRYSVTSIAGPNGVAQLYEREREVLRGRQSGVDLKPPQAAVVKSDGGERCGKVGTGFRQARLREASASEPLQKCRNRIRRCQNRGADPSSGISLGDALRLPKRHPACRRREAQPGSRKKLTGSGHATNSRRYRDLSSTCLCRGRECLDLNGVAKVGQAFD